MIRAGKLHEPGRSHVARDPTAPADRLDLIIGAMHHERRDGDRLHRLSAIERPIHPLGLEVPVATGRQSPPSEPPRRDPSIVDVRRDERPHGLPSEPLGAVPRAHEFQVGVPLLLGPLPLVVDLLLPARSGSEEDEARDALGSRRRDRRALGPRVRLPEQDRPPRAGHVDDAQDVVRQILDRRQIVRRESVGQAGPSAIHQDHPREVAQSPDEPGVVRVLPDDPRLLMGARYRRSTGPSPTTS